MRRPRKTPISQGKDTPKLSDITIGFDIRSVVMAIARFYPTIDKVVLELCQNVIDARGNAIIKLDLKKRKLNTWDDGKGTDLGEMRQRIGRLGRGGGTKGKDDIGEMNFGNISPIGIANKYSLISHDRDKKGPFFKVIFDRDLLDQEVPCFKSEETPGFSFSGDQKGITTAIVISGIEESALRGIKRKKNPAEYLCDLLADAYGAKIKQTGVKITIQVIDENNILNERVVIPQEFPGKREHITIETAKGPVKFDIFLTRSKQKSPKILADHQGRFKFHLSNMREEIWRDVSDVLGSGHFQGSIKADFCQLSEDRTRFVYSDGLQSYIDAILKFVDDYARPWMEELAEQQDIEQFEDVARDVIAGAEELVRDHPGLLSEVFRGEISNGHVGSDKGVTGAKISTRKKKKKESDVPDLKSKEEKNQKERDQIHGGVVSKSGSRRKSVEGQAGLVLYPGEGTGWRAKIGTESEEKGKIVINLAHPDYRDSQNAGKSALDTYLRLLVMGILSKALMPNDRASVFHEEYEEVFIQFRKMLVPQIPKKA